MLGLVGVIAIEVSEAAVTLKLAELEVIDPEVAVIVVEPLLTPVAKPLLLMVALAVFAELQVAVALRF
jgi:hypothetical protein